MQLSETGKVYQNGGIALVIKNNRLHEWLAQFGKSHEKYVPNEIKNMEPDKIRIFLDAYIQGDGRAKKPSHKFNNGNTRNTNLYSTSSKKLADDLGELILKVGRRPSFYLSKPAGTLQKLKNKTYFTKHDNWEIRECYRQKSWTRADAGIKKEIVNYSDMVYCVGLPKYHTLWVRRNGKTVWSGNCMCYTINLYPEIKDYIRSLREEAHHAL